MKALSLLSLVAALAIGGYLVREQVRTVGPTSERGQALQESATAGVAGANLRSAAAALEATRAASGTYAGADLSGFGVRLVRADGSSYCLQAGEGAAATHLSGPQGSPAPGPC